jgi:hypothetical protein
MDEIPVTAETLAGVDRILQAYVLHGLDPQPQPFDKGTGEAVPVIEFLQAAHGIIQNPANYKLVSSLENAFKDYSDAMQAHADPEGYEAWLSSPEGQKADPATRSERLLRRFSNQEAFETEQPEYIERVKAASVNLAQAFRKALMERFDFTPNLPPFEVAADLVRSGALPDLPGRITVLTSQLEQGVTANLSAIRNWQIDASGRHAQGTTIGKTKGFQVGTLLRVDMWETLKDKPARVVKMWVALQARSTEARNPLAPFAITPERLARDINADDRGYVPATTKQQVADQLDAMLSLDCQFVWKDHKGTHRVRGPLFNRLATHETHEDLFNWVPNAVLIQRNPAMYDGQDAEFLRKHDTCTRALLALHAQKDESAIMLGVYLLCKARAQTHQYSAGEARFKNQTLIQVLVDSGAIQPIEKYAASRNEFKVKSILQKALDRLKEIEFLDDHGPVTEAAGTDNALETADDILEAFPVEKRAKKGAFWKWLNETTAVFLPEENRALQESARIARKTLNGRRRSGQRYANQVQTDA